MYRHSLPDALPTCLIALEAQVVLEAADDLRLVVDDQDARHAPSVAPGSGHVSQSRQIVRSGGADLARSSRGGIEVDEVPLGNGLPISRTTPLNEPAFFEEEPVGDVAGARVETHLANF